MEILTKKELANAIKTNTYIEYNKAQYKEMSKPTYEELYLKVNAIEEIQEELGIPLEVLFKALKEGIYIIDACEIIRLNHTEISLHYNGVQWLWETPYGTKPFRNYKNTWWFSKEEVEE